MNPIELSQLAVPTVLVLAILVLVAVAVVAFKRTAQTPARRGWSAAGIALAAWLLFDASSSVAGSLPHRWWVTPIDGAWYYTSAVLALAAMQGVALVLSIAAGGVAVTAWRGWLKQPSAGERSSISNRTRLIRQWRIEELLERRVANTIAETLGGLAGDGAGVRLTYTRSSEPEQVISYYRVELPSSDAQASYAESSAVAIGTMADPSISEVVVVSNDQVSVEWNLAMIDRPLLVAARDWDPTTGSRVERVELPRPVSGVTRLRDAFRSFGGRRRSEVRQ